MCIRDSNTTDTDSEGNFIVVVDKAKAVAEANGVGSVSYTHLDVYKRQPQRGAGQHHSGGGEHDFGKRRGYDVREHRVKSKVGDKTCKITARQNAGRQEQGDVYKRQQSIRRRVSGL